MNYLKSLLSAIPLLLVFCIGCNRSEETSLSTAGSVSSYQYRAYDLDGAVVAMGTLSLSFEGDAITGQRDIKGDAAEAGVGIVVGQMQSDGAVQIELNPGLAAVVILKGKRDGLALTGDRLFDSGTSPIARKIGTFLATPALVGNG